MDKGKCTFGTRMPIDVHMLNEMIYRETRHFRNYKIYRPNFGAIPVAGKFYAAHDQLLAETDEEVNKVDAYHEGVSQTRAKGPHTKQSHPATENQVYGWYKDAFTKVDRNDRRFYQPLAESTHTKIQVVIMSSNPKGRA